MREEVVMITTTATTTTTVVVVAVAAKTLEVVATDLASVNLQALEMRHLGVKCRLNELTLMKIVVDEEMVVHLPFPGEEEVPVIDGVVEGGVAVISPPLEVGPQPLELSPQPPPPCRPLRKEVEVAVM